MRIALGIEYRGDRFHGFQVQRTLPTVQGDLEQALSRVADHPVRISAAGRTDAGVHAVGQVVSFATRAERPLKAWWLGVNALTSDGVKVLWAQAVDDGFHARYSASARRYLYLYLVRPTPSPLLAPFVTRVDALDADAMHRAARVLIGEHDFSSFRGAGCQSQSPWRRVNALEVRAAGDLVVIDVEGNAFLLHMVRNLAAALAEVGRGARAEAWPGQLLAARDRRLNVATAPPGGLYLASITYPGRDFPAAPLPGPMAALGGGAWALDRTPPFL